MFRLLDLSFLFITNSVQKLIKKKNNKIKIHHQVLNYLFHFIAFFSSYNKKKENFNRANKIALIENTHLLKFYSSNKIFLFFIFFFVYLCLHFISLNVLKLFGFCMFGHYYLI